jgi:hypothetical protein
LFLTRWLLLQSKVWTKKRYIDDHFEEKEQCPLSLREQRCPESKTSCQETLESETASHSGYGVGGESHPNAKDVIKASANLEGFSVTYNQGYRAVATAKSLSASRSHRSFQLIGPYIEKFKELNENSIAVVDINDSTNMVKRVFICPGIMDKALKHVRPIISLDAAHLKSEWKGTLYIASVKSACDEIYPVAVAITEQNENFDGWRWVLEHLQEGVPTLVLPHPQKEVTKKYFTFMSDRQKGLLVEALKDFSRESFVLLRVVRYFAKFY